MQTSLSLSILLKNYLAHCIVMIIKWIKLADILKCLEVCLKQHTVRAIYMSVKHLNKWGLKTSSPFNIARETLEMMRSTCTNPTPPQRGNSGGTSAIPPAGWHPGHLDHLHGCFLPPPSFPSLLLGGHFACYTNFAVYCSIAGWPERECTHCSVIKEGGGKPHSERGSEFAYYICFGYYFVCHRFPKLERYYIPLDVTFPYESWIRKLNPCFNNSTQS